jgi:hypothetical protein
MAKLRLEAHRYIYLEKEIHHETHCFGRSANMRVNFLRSEPKGQG